MRQLLVWTLLLAAGGCARPPARTSATAPRPPTVASAAAAGGDENPVAGLCIDDSGCRETQLCLRTHCVDIGPSVAECNTARVYFDRNSSELRDKDEPALRRLARCLKANRALRVTIEGHTDQRGDAAANLVMGDRRATAVAEYLRSQGISEEQLRLVTYGSEQPLCVERDEVCWRLNRRATLRPWEARRPGGPGSL